MDARAQYRRTRIMTASPGEILVMLYDGLLRRLKTATRVFEAGTDIARAGEALGRCQEILHELSACLDRDAYPQLADNLGGLYAYSSRTLLEAVAAGDAAKVREVYDLIRPIRDAFAEARRAASSAAGGLSVSY